MSVVVDIKLESPQWDAVSDTENTVRRAIYAAVAEVGPSDAELGVVLADDARIRTLNRIWLGNDKATNVLSFPSPPEPDGSRRFLGDIVFALETIQHEARAEGKSLEQHLAHLAVHGVLHLLGFDHVRIKEARTMEDLERRILARLGIPNPHATARERRREPA